MYSYFEIRASALAAPRQIEILERTKRIMLSERTLKRRSSGCATRAQGYAVSEGKNVHGLRTVAAPIFDATGAPVAGLSLTIDAGRMPLEPFVAQSAPEVRRVAAALTGAMRHAAGAIGAGGAL